jgi:hypothetical protein
MMSNPDIYGHESSGATVPTIVPASGQNGPFRDNGSQLVRARRALTLLGIGRNSEDHGEELGRLEPLNPSAIPVRRSTPTTYGPTIVHVIVPIAGLRGNPTHHKMPGKDLAPVRNAARVEAAPRRPAGDVSSPPGPRLERVIASDARPRPPNTAASAASPRRRAGRLTRRPPPA